MLRGVRKGLGAREDKGSKHEMAEEKVEDIGYKSLRRGRRLRGRRTSRRGDAEALEVERGGQRCN